MEYFISAFLGMLLGSFPSAFIVLRISKGIDIRDEGSSNIGAHNSYRVSNSKIIGIAVLALDMLKGFLAVYSVGIIYEPNFFLQMIALDSAVLAHCFSPWLKFKGGRGLATAAGGSVLIIPAIFILWCVIWIVAFIFRKNIYFGNISASILTPAVTLSSLDILNKYSYPPAESELVFGITIALLFVIILIKHIEPIKEWIKTREKQIKDRKI